MIPELLNDQKSYFKTGQTLSITYRKTLLKALLNQLVAREKDITDALYNDFKKPEFESVLTETAIVIQDLKYTIKKLNKWAKPKRVFPAMLNFPSSDYLYAEPYGSVLVIAPWNYPYQLALAPLVGAIAAGNTVILKPTCFAVSSSG